MSLAPHAADGLSASRLGRIGIGVGLLLIAALPPAVVMGLWHPEARAAWAEGRHAVTVAQVRAWSEPVLWVDARTLDEYRAGHLPGALPLSAEAWDAQLVELLMQWEPGRKVVVYCSRTECRTSAVVAARLRQDLGSPDVFHLVGGYEAWQEAAP